MSDTTETIYGLILREGSTATHLVDLDDGTVLCGAEWQGVTSMHGQVPASTATCQGCISVATWRATGSTTLASTSADEITAAASIEALDQYVHFGRGRYVVTRIVQGPGGHKVKVKISRYAGASSTATASVLANDLSGWTELCSASPIYWHGNTPHAPKHDEAAITGCSWLVDELIVRAFRILA